MAKNIVVCSDGTGNSAFKDRGTNVFKLYEAVDLNGHRKDSGLTQQIALYDDGVGTESLKLWKALTGAFGWGLTRNVQELYAELARVYEPGDRLFLFGFSRGAFTVRTLAGVIGELGVLDRRKFRRDTDLQKAVKAAYREHRRHYRTVFGRLFHPRDDPKRLEMFRAHNSVCDDAHNPGGLAPIQFVGVWDTVDAVGFPSDFLADLWNSLIYRFKFPDTTLGPMVQKACHAMAIDDERHTFHPVVWNETGESGGRIEQVWFAGAHSNVGGGYPKQGMSLIPLLWMMRHAENEGLRFVQTVRALYEETQYVGDKLYNSRAGLSTYYRYKPRDIGFICSRCGVTPKIHMSVIDRIAQGTDGYAPGNLPPDLQIVGDDVPTLAEHAQGVIRGELRRAGSLLERTKTWIKLREWAHYLFTIASVAAVLWAWGRSGVSLGDAATTSGAFKILKTAVWNEPLVAAVVVVFYGIGRWCTNKSVAVYSEFWYHLRPELRPDTEKRRAAAAAN